MIEREFRIFAVFIAVFLSLFCMLFVHASYGRKSMQPQLLLRAEMVKQYDLTDICLFTDARYTRHPSMADLNTPFQDYPISFEHFPSGSLLGPPPHLVAHGLD